MERGLTRIKRIFADRFEKMGIDPRESAFCCEIQKKRPAGKRLRSTFREILTEQNKNNRSNAVGIISKTGNHFSRDRNKSMDNLKIKLDLKDHPYRTAPGANLEAWGSISVDILSGADVKRLVQIEWDVLCLAEWYVDNKAMIEAEDFLILGEKANPGESISEALLRIGIQKFDLPWQKPENVIEEEMKIYDAYHERHSPGRDMYGSGMPEIFIGLNSGRGEISLFNETENWKYEFDMGLFINGFNNEIRRSISKWLETNNNPDAQRRGLHVVNNL